MESNCKSQLFKDKNGLVNHCVIFSRLQYRSQTTRTQKRSLFRDTWQSTFPVWRISWKKKTWIQLKQGETLENRYFARHWLHFYFLLRHLDYILNRHMCRRHQTNSYLYFQGVTVILWLLCCLLRLDEQLQVSVCNVFNSFLFLL